MCTPRNYAGELIILCVAKKVSFVFCFKHCECLFILSLGLSIQTGETLTMSQDKGGRRVFKPVFSRERRMDLAPTHLTLKIWIPICNPGGFSTGPQSLVPHALPQPLFFLLLSWDFSFVPYPWNKRNKPRDSLSESAVYIPAEVCLENRMLIKQFFTHWWSFLLVLFLFFYNSLQKKRDGFKNWCNWYIIWLSQ